MIKFSGLGSLVLTGILAASLSACSSMVDRQQVEFEGASLAATPAVESRGDVRSAPADGSGLTTAQARKALLGKWYGIANSKTGIRKEWLVERAEDGTYRTDFRSTHPDGRVESQAEVGFWGVSGDVYFRIFRGWVMVDGMKLANAKNPSHYDAYRIDHLSSELMRYQHVDDGRRYIMKRMPENFRLPVVLEQKDTAPLKFEF